MFAPVDITIGAYCLRLYFQSFSNIQPESVLKNKWLSSFQKKKEKNPSDIPYFCFNATPIKPFFFLGLSVKPTAACLLTIV